MTTELTPEQAGAIDAYWRAKTPHDELAAVSRMVALGLPDAYTGEVKRPRPNATNVRVVRLPHAAELPLPTYASAHAAGLDLRAAVADPVVIGPGQRALVPTGLCVALPAGYEMQIRPRSGLALHFGVTVANAPGTVDADYRGEVMVIMLNGWDKPFTVKRGDRIAQAVLAPVTRATLVEVDSLDETDRGAGGFGSTGV